jgi:hypothetical protein
MAQKIEVLKPAFTGGEFAPSLWSRIDLQRYGSGCRRLRNTFPHPHGGASNRPGFYFIKKPKYSNKKCRGVGFEFSADQVYSIEFGEYYCRFYMNDGQLIAPTTTAAWVTATVYYIGDFVKVGGVIYRSKTNHTSGAGHATPPGNVTDWEASDIYEIETPYAEDDLEDLQFTQSADVLYVTHNDFCPRTITRYSHYSWRIALYPFEEGPFMQQNIDEDLTLTANAVTGSAITLTASKALFEVGHVGALFKVEHNIESQFVSKAFTAVGETTSIKCGPNGTWRLVTHGIWTGTIKIEKSIDGGTTWSSVRSFTSYDGDINHNTYGDFDEDDAVLVRVKCTIFTSGTINVDLSTDAFTQVGIVKITAFTSATVVTAEVLKEVGATTATEFWSEGSWSEKRGYPATCMFEQDRLVFGATKSEILGVWSTKTNNYINFGRSDPLVDSDGISIRLPSRKMDAVKSFILLGDILAFTSSRAWSIGSSSEGVLTPTTVYPKLQEGRGSSKVLPVVIGNRVIYVQPMGTVVWDLGYDYISDGYTGDPLSLLSNQLFEGHRIIDMAYQKEPDSLVWLVRDDGMLLSMTYLREQEIVAWAWHDTDGQVESIWTIPNATVGYDEVWVVVKRGTERFIEKMVKRMISTDPRKQFFVDCGISYDNPMTITGATQASPVVITTEEAHGFSNGDLVDILEVKGMTELNGKRFKVANVSANAFELTDPEDDSDIDGTEYTAYEEDGEVRKTITTVPDLDHLEGKTVSVVADGNWIEGMVVEDGEIVLSNPASIIHVGLPYICDVEPLDGDINTDVGTTHGKLANVARLRMHFLNSRGGFIGSSEDNLDPIKIGRTSEAIGEPIELFSGFHEQAIPGGYKKSGRVFFRQTAPFPFTILSIVPVTILGG